nr:MAG TPA_asm: hypothetical protein [Caudoviricetes sp.]
MVELCSEWLLGDFDCMCRIGLVGLKARGVYSSRREGSPR